MYRFRNILTLRKALVMHTLKRNIRKPAPRYQPHMNELPIPCIPWDNWYKNKQSYYNKVLLVGVLWWLFSFGMLVYTESMFLNFYPPAEPAPSSNMVDECEDVED